MAVDKIEIKDHSIDYEKLLSMTFKSTKKALFGVEDETRKLDNDEGTLQFLGYAEGEKYKKYSYTLDCDYSVSDVIFMMKQMELVDSDNQSIKVVDKNGKQYNINDQLKKGSTVNILVQNTDVKIKAFGNTDIEEKYISSVQGDPDRKLEREKGYTLSEKDFKNYFEGDNFQQRDIGNCRLLAGVDSITHLGNYKDLIMRSVKKTEKGFLFRIPLGSNSNTAKYYQVNDDFDNQLNIVGGSMTFISSKKQGLKALAIACGQAVTGKENFDVSAVSGGNSWKLFTKIFEGAHIYHDDWYSSKDDVEHMLNNLDYIMNNFDSQNSLLTIGVSPIKGAMFDYKNSNSFTTHAISIERTFKDSNGDLKVVVSNPWDSSQSKIKSWSELRKQCGSYSFCTFGPAISIDSEIKKTDIKGNTDEYRDEKRNRDTTGYVENEAPERRNGEYATLDGVIQISGKCDEELRKERGGVTVNTTKRDRNGRPIAIKVKSRGKEADIVEKKDKFIMNIQGKEFEIHKNFLSPEFNGHKNDLYKMYLYAPRISVLINRMIHDYIDDKKRDKKNNKPFTIKNGKLEFDDDPSKFSGKDGLKRRGAELLGDDTITVLEDRSKLGIIDRDLKYKIAEYLNSFCI